MESVYLSLEKEERNFKSTDESYCKKLKSWKQWKSESANRQKANERIMKGIASEGKDAFPESRIVNSEDTEYASFDPDAPLQEFCYVNIKCGVSLGEIKEEVADLFNITELERNALLRGIAVHHAGSYSFYY